MEPHRRSAEGAVGMNWTKSPCSWCCGWCWAVQIPSACAEIRVDSGPTIAALQVFVSWIGSAQAFCLSEPVEANQQGRITFPPSPHFLSLFMSSMQWEKSLIWMFYGFSKFLFTHASKPLYGSDEFLNSRYIMDAVDLFMDKKPRAGLQTCIFWKWNL